ncbi:uncharacterized protein F4812DRAFT_78050 [Daldinia caldariorum]|uniref:uncharacterized protein n=1 Tax=Daldinia caldariorum TaxID=326644 RepID=UPI00200796E1|nr:uncharacterized protein F4812DRAFT_78050 [Daldinia caldariorum]KAI1466410.1 hypothetical protein F4812DRAFT_78050 [Daldinia caldariorum]
MGRLEPLTSLALGRSPYDDVVPGEGEADPHEPEKQYDSTGRIVNPRTKRIIKDIIRAHNEVMLVIGVAEPENGGISLAEQEITRQYHEYESDTGKTLYQAGSTLGIICTWGVLNIRRRILVYKRHADVSFFRMIQAERRNHSVLQLCSAGYPCHLVMHALRLTSRYMRIFTSRGKNPWFHAAIEYIRFHLHLFLTMQRLDLVPASQLLPGPKFFIPFSSSSPFVAPPPIKSISISTISSWTGQLIIGLAPYAAFYVCGFIWQSTCAAMRISIRKHLPRPLLNFPTNSRISGSISTTHRPAVPESPTLGAADRDIRHQNPEVDVATSLVLDVQSNSEAVPVGSIRRQSTFSSRGGEDYGTDDEDSEMVNPTLISFDVDTSESTEPPTGVWSAELRPSVPGDSRQQPKEAPCYIVNPLTNLPCSFAADILANFVTNILFLPIDSHAFPMVARALARRSGLPYEDMYVRGFLGGLTWRGVLNILQLDIVKLLISGEVWVFTTVISQWLHVTEEEWKEIRKEEDQE